MKSTWTSLGVGLALAAACAGARAGLHQICYEGQPEVKKGVTYYKMVVGCSNELGGTCEIRARPTSGGIFTRDPLAINAAYVQSTGSFEHWQWKGPVGTLTYDIVFKDALGGPLATRACAVSIGQGHAHGYRPSEPAVLTGFSTDSSGLVTTGVWRNRAAYIGEVAQVMLPGGFAAVGGGVQTADGAFVAHSRRTSDGRGWQVASYTDAVGTAQEIPATTSAIAIGMQVSGLHLDDQRDPYRKDAFGNPLLIPGLLSLIGSHGGSSAPTPQAFPVAVATPPIIFGVVGLGGEFSARADRTNSPTGRGQYGMGSAPQLARPLLNCVLVGVPCRLQKPVASAWRAESTDDVGNHPGHIGTNFLTLPLTLEAGGQTWEVRGAVVRAAVPAGSAPAGSVAGLRGTYALTGVGAEVQWRAFNGAQMPKTVSTRLAVLEPRAELGGGSAATRQGSVVTPAALDVYGLGIRLVKPGTEPEGIERPPLSIKERVWLPWLCQAVEGLGEWSGCKAEKSVRLDTLCSSFPDLPDHGICIKP